MDQRGDNHCIGDKRIVVNAETNAYQDRDSDQQISQINEGNILQEDLHLSEDEQMDINNNYNPNTRSSLFHGDYEEFEFTEENYHSMIKHTIQHRHPEATRPRPRPRVEPLDKAHEILLHKKFEYLQKTQEQQIRLKVGGQECDLFGDA